MADPAGSFEELGLSMKRRWCDERARRIQMPRRLGRCRRLSIWTMALFNSLGRNAFAHHAILIANNSIDSMSLTRAIRIDWGHGRTALAAGAAIGATPPSPQAIVEPELIR